MCEHESRERAMVTVGHTDTGKAIFCDPCIAPLVSSLNQAGLATTSSCCGHDHNPAWVTLADDRVVMILGWDDAHMVADLLHARDGCKPGFECDTCRPPTCGGHIYRPHTEACYDLAVGL